MTTSSLTTPSLPRYENAVVLVTPAEAELLAAIKCPSWCHNKHTLAGADGCDFESASTHMGPELSGTIYQLTHAASGKVAREGSGAWHLSIEADYIDFGDLGSGWAPPFLCISINDGHTSYLSAGEARSLARQLTHLADLADLNS